MKVNDVNGNTQDIRGPAKYMPSSFLAPVMGSAGTAYLTRVLNGLGAVFVGIVRWVGERQIRHEMWLELQAMSDAALQDLGITRRGIDAAVNAAMASRRAGGRRVATTRVHDIPAAANDDSMHQAA
jgi:uncharacterized protein YjiS (DUF1127 family)